MPSVETTAQNFRTLLRIRTLCLGLMFLLLWWAEDLSAAPAVSVGWALLAFAALLGLLFMGLGRAKRISGFLLPTMILLDTLLVALWVLVSGGAVSYYMPFFLLVLMSAIMMLDHIRESSAARRIESALERVYREAKSLTKDVGGSATTAEFTQSVIRALVN